MCFCCQFHLSEIMTVSAEVGLTPGLCVDDVRAFYTDGILVFTQFCGSSQSTVCCKTFPYLCLQFPMKWMGVRKNCERLWKECRVSGMLGAF